MRKNLCYLILFVLYSCVNDNIYTPVADASSTDESNLITVEIEAPETGRLTRTSFTESQLDRIFNLNIFIYHNGNLLREYCQYYTDMSSLMLKLPHSKNGFNIYMIGNVKKLNAPVNEDDIGKLSYTVESYDEFKVNGFPVAAAFIGYKKGDTASFKVKRMVGQYNIRMRTSATNAAYHIKSIRLYNCAKDMYPFSTDTKARVMAETGDSLTAEDLTALNAGQSVSLYFIENMQGVLLPDNTDRKKKIPSSLEYIESGAADRCTYIEITADITTPAASYTNGKYRFYLGQDETSDFNIKRNTLHNVTLDFTQNMVNEEEWRIEVDEPEITMGFRLDKEEAMVIKGAEDMIFVQAKDKMGNMIDFNVDILSSNGYINVEKIDTYFLENENLGEAIGLRFTSNLALSGLYAFDTEPEYKIEKVRISSKETYNGNPLYTKDIKVRVYDKMFPLLIKLEKFQNIESNPYEIILRGRNPMKLGLAVSGSYISDGTTKELSEFEKYDYILNGVRTDRTVNPEGVSFGDLPDVTISNLSRIDFTIRGVAKGTGKTIAYPRLLSSDRIHTGANSAAFFGPGSDLYPAKFPKMADDAKYYMKLIDPSGSDITVSYSTDSGKFGVKKTFDGFRLCYVTPWSLRNDTQNEQWQDYYFFGKFQGMHSKEYDPDSSFYNDYSQYEDTPFYFLNGGMIIDNTYSYMDHQIDRYPNNSSRKFSYRFYGPGRDLFPELKETADYTYSLYHYHSVTFGIWTRRPMIGSTIRTGVETRKYECSLYMTINGASAWCGNDITNVGYSTDDH